MGILVYNEDKKGGNTPVLPKEEKAGQLLEEVEVLMATYKITQQLLSERLGYNRRSIYVWFQNPETHYAKLIMVRNKIKQIVEEQINETN